MLYSGIALVLAAGVVAGGLVVGPDHAMEHKASVDDRLDRLKSLVGEWVSSDEDGDGQPDYEVHYRLTAARNAVIATQFPGEMHEMVNVFHLDGDEVVVTHYCALGNQPHLGLEPGDAEKLHFTFRSATNLASRDDHHMGELVMTFPDENTIVEEWTAFKDGEVSDNARFEVTRKPDVAKVESIVPDEFEQFFMVVLSAGPKRTDEITDEVEERQAAHMQHLTDMHNDGLLALAGPFGDGGGGGMLVLRVETMDEAQELMDNDPHVKAGWLKAEIRPWLTQKGKL